MPGRSPFAVVAIVLLMVAAFGGLSVGVPLTMQLLSGPATPDVTGFVLLLLGYGLVSLVGALAVLLHWRRATLLIGLIEGVVAASLLGLYVGVAADWSLLAVAAIAGGAAICALADLRLTRRSAA